MSSIVVEKHLSSPIEAVFDVLTDHANYDRFSNMRRSELLREGTEERNGVGALRRLSSGPFTFEEEVTAFERPTRMDYLITKVNLPIDHTGGSVQLTPAQGGGTDARWSSDFTTSVPVIGGAVGGMLGMALKRGFVSMLEDIDRLASHSRVSTAA